MYFYRNLGDYSHVNQLLLYVLSYVWVNFRQKVVNFSSGSASWEIFCEPQSFSCQSLVEHNRLRVELGRPDVVKVVEFGQLLVLALQRSNLPYKHFEE